VLVPYSSYKNMDHMNSLTEYFLKTRRYLLPLILACAAIAVYANSFGNGFVWDDSQIIVTNNENRDLSKIPGLFVSTDTAYTYDESSYYRPLNRLTYVLEYKLYELNPFGYHAGNILLHATAVLLLYYLLNSLFSSTGLAFTTALLFAVHPINSETVNFISARNNILSTVFVLSSFIVFIRAEIKQKTVYFWFSGFLFFLGLLSKEIAAMLPIMLLAYNFKFSSPIAKKIRQKFISLLPFAFFAIIYIVLRAITLSNNIEPVFNTNNFGVRILQNIYIIPKYLSVFFLPSNLNAYYLIPEDYLHFKTFLISGWAIIMLLLFYLIKSKRPAAIFGLVWFAVNFIPISNIIAIPSAQMAERYMYLPAIGLFIITAEYLNTFYMKGIWNKAVISCFVIIIFALSLITVKRNTIWKNDFSLFESITISQPESPFGYYNLGCVYKGSGDLQNAKKEWEKTLEIAPLHSNALNQLGNIYYLSGLLTKAKVYYYSSVQSDPENAEAHYNLAMTLENLNDTDEAFLHYSIFLQKASPEYATQIQQVKNKFSGNLSRDQGHFKER